jgi:hypothetical protein
MDILVNLNKEDAFFCWEYKNPELESGNYVYAGKVAICESVQQWREELSPCCGMYTTDLVLPSGKKVVFCFDYGH